MDQSTAPQMRKLKILCFHGFNNNIEVLRFMTQSFRDLFDEIADFHFIDAPYEIDESIIPAEPALAKLGFKGPFKAWFAPIPINQKKVDKELKEYIETHEALPDGLKFRVSNGIEKSIDLVKETIEQHGPFDGVLSFSQGSAMFRIFNAMTQLIHADRYKNLEMPRFIISFAGAVFLEYLLHVDDRLYGPSDCLMTGIDSLHVYGLADPLVDHCRQEVGLYNSGPQTIKNVVIHSGGHKVPNKFTSDQLDVIQKFVMY